MLSLRQEKKSSIVLSILPDVLQFRRNNEVTVANVIGPLLLLLLCTFVLLTIWTVRAPFHWNRHVISHIPFETYGECDCDNLGHILVLTWVSC